MSPNPPKFLVGVIGFEPTTPASRTLEPARKHWSEPATSPRFVPSEFASRPAFHGRFMGGRETEAKKNPATVAAARGAIDRKHHGSDRPKSYAERSRRATERLRDLARDLRRGPDPYRSDPERAFAHRDSIAHQLRLIADELEAAHG